MEQDHDVHLKWNMHHDTLTSVFTNLLESEKLVDCIVSAEGQCLNVHKIVLSACSPYFELLFSQHYERYPIIVLQDVKFQVLRALIYFMYCGEMSVSKDELDPLLKTAEFLQVKGLSTTVDVNTGSNPVSERKNYAGQCKQSLPEMQRSRGEKTMEGNPPHLRFQRKCDTGVSAAHKQKESDLCSSSGFRTPGGSSTMKGENTCKLASSCSSTGLRVVKTEPHDNISEICSSPYSPSSGGNYSQTLGEVTSNDPVVLKTEFSTPISAMPTEEAVDEGVFDPGVSTGVPRESEFEDFDDDDMEIIALDDELESGCRVSKVHNTSCNQPFLDSKPPSPAQQSGQADGAGALVQEVPNQSNLFKCPLCGSLYQHYRSLIRHAKYECGKEPQFKCPQCQTCYTQKSYLRIHMIRMHHLNPKNKKE